MFRPLPVLTLLAIPMLAALVWLGVWQAQRAQWKAGLIAEFEVQAEAAPLDAGVALCSPEPALPYGAVLSGDSVRGLSDPNPPVVIRMFGQATAGQPGWALLTPLTPPDCAGKTAAPILFERGFEVLQVGPLPADTRVVEPPGRYIVAQWPKKPGLAAANDPDANDWHWFDTPALAGALGVSGINDRYYLKAFNGELPDRLTRTPPATHYGYAVTWFGMALALIVIYAAFHARAGRLRFSKDGSGKAQ